MCMLSYVSAQLIMLLLSKCLISQVTRWCIHHWHGPTWWQSLLCTLTSYTTRISQDSLLSDRTSSGKNGREPLTRIKKTFKNCFQRSFQTRLLQLVDICIMRILCVLSFNAVHFLQPPSGKSGHRCARQLLSLLAHQPTSGHQQRRVQRQLRLETGRCPIECADTQHLTCVHWWHLTSQSTFWTDKMLTALCPQSRLNTFLLTMWPASVLQINFWLRLNCTRNDAKIMHSYA